jgi:hypothetical protein
MMYNYNNWLIELLLKQMKILMVKFHTMNLKKYIKNKYSIYLFKQCYLIYNKFRWLKI